MLSSQLATGGAVTFAKCCKSLRRVQTPAGCKSPAAAQAGGVLCTKFLLQNFYDPNCAGGCGVAPFPSWIRFRLPAVAYAVGRCCTNERKAARWRPSIFAPAVARSVVSGEVCGYAAFCQAIRGPYLLFNVPVLVAAAVNCAACPLAPVLG